MEQNMTQLKSLTFAALPKLTAADPVIHRRNKLIVRLQQQIALVQDPQFTLTRQKWVTDELRGDDVTVNMSQIKQLDDVYKLAATPQVGRG
jgi:hypothetical protein